MSGVAKATKTLAYYAKENEFGQILLTDVDIYRFPFSIKRLKEESINYPQGLVYGNYAAYPLEVLEILKIPLDEDEKILWQIFQADKNPLIRPFVKNQRKKRFKSSLVMGKPETFISGLNYQNITTDSVISHIINDYHLVPNAAYLHHGRFDLLDYIQARFRHIRVAILEGRFNTTYYRQEVIYTKKEIEDISRDILTKHPNSEEHRRAVSFFLIQAALRYEIYEIGKQLFSTKNNDFLKNFPQSDLPISSLVESVTNLEEAKNVARALIGKVKEQIDPSSTVSKGISITQPDWRFPIDCEFLIKNYDFLKEIIHGWLGLSNNEEL